MAAHYVFNNSDRLEEECFKFANHLIEQCKLHVPVVNCLKDINSNLIVSLYENITGFSILDLLSCENTIDEAHNVQAVIDALSLDLLGISLSHITGEDVVAGDIIAIYNLLEILDSVSLFLSGEKDNASTSNSHSISTKKGTKRKISRLSNRKQKLQPTSFESAKTNEDLISRVDSSFISSSSTYYIPSPPDHHALRHEKAKEKSPVQSKDTCTGLSVAHKTLRPKRIQRKLTPTEISPIPSTNDVTSIHSKFVSNMPEGLFQRSEIGKLTKKEKQQDFVEEPCNLNYTHTVRQSEHTGSSYTRTKKVKTIDSVQLKENKKPQKEDIDELYEKNLENKIRLFLEKNSSCRKNASEMKKRYRQQIRKPLHMSPIKPCKKSFLLPHNLRHRSLSHTSAKRLHSSRFQSTGKQGKDEKSIPKESAAFIEELRQEFPGVPLSPDTLKRISKTYNQHLMTMHKQLKDCLLKKSRVQIQAEEAAKRQALLSEILHKEIQQTQQLKDVKKHKKIESKIKYHLRDARLQSAKVKQYCKEFHEEMRKKMQKRNFTEELIVENAFKEALNIEKEQVQYLCKDVKETEEQDARQHRMYLDAIENLYKTQFSLLAESLAIEKKDAEERLKAQKKVMRMMQQEFRENLKEEIREMQKNTVEIMQDTHFRELDAEQYKAKMRQRFH